jgi:transcriptional regulator with XRE-family HTH domain
MILKTEQRQAKFCRMLREIRLAANLRQKDVAEKLNRPQTYVSKYESGEKSLDIFELQEIGAVLGFSLKEIAQKIEDLS